MYNSSEDLDIEDLSFEELVYSWKKLSTRNMELCQLGEDQHNLIIRLQDERLKHLGVISDLEDEVVLANSKLDSMVKIVRMLNSSSNVLDEILQSGRNDGNGKGLGYNDQVGKEHAMNSDHPKRKQNRRKSNKMSQHHRGH